jgi:predicted HD phosphohydrolase
MELAAPVISAAFAGLLCGSRRPGQHGRAAEEGTGITVDIVTAFGELLDGEGGRDYLGEPVTVATHMLRAGGLARKAGTPDALVVAASLHDVGHCIDKKRCTETEHHDEAGGRWLASWFGAEVTEPVRLHVLANAICARSNRPISTYCPLLRSARSG